VRASGSGPYAAMQIKADKIQKFVVSAAQNPGLDNSNSRGPTR